MEGLGLNLTWFLFQLGNFVLVFAILTYLLHKPLLKLLDDRNRGIKESLETAENLKKEAVESERRQQNMLEAAQTQANQLLSQTKQQARELEERLATQAQEKAEALLKKAAEDIQREHDQMKAELRGELADLVIRTTEKVVGTQVPEVRKQEQIRQLLEEL